MVASGNSGTIIAGPRDAMFISQARRFITDRFDIDSKNLAILVLARLQHLHIR